MKELTVYKRTWYTNWCINNQTWLYQVTTHLCEICIFNRDKHKNMKQHTCIEYIKMVMRFSLAYVCSVAELICKGFYYFQLGYSWSYMIQSFPFL